jgi:hypothetical protein
MKTLLSIIAALIAFASAACWFRAATVQITMEQHQEREQQKAAKEGRSPDLSGVSLGGIGLHPTLQAQSRWNAWGAGLAAVAVILQTITTFLPDGTS